jgi:hypothetical protein
MNFLQKLNIKIDKALLIAFLGLGVAVLFINLFSSPSSSELPVATSEETGAIDTMIPAGHLLIPLELSNAESLSSLSGNFSVVDLYVAGDRGKKGFKIASAVKLLRAPLNPQQFAVLVREEDSSKIVTHEGPFFAALKNPKEMARVKATKNPLLIQYGE